MQMEFSGMIGGAVTVVVGRGPWAVELVDESSLHHAALVVLAVSSEGAVRRWIHVAPGRSLLFNPVDRGFHSDGLCRGRHRGVGPRDGARGRSGWCVGARLVPVCVESRQPPGR